MFPNNLTTDGLPKPNTLQSASHIILESYTGGILPVHGTVICNVALCKIVNLIQIRFFIVGTKKKKKKNKQTKLYPMQPVHN